MVKLSYLCGFCFRVIYFIERNAAKTRYTEIAEENDVQ